MMNSNGWPLSRLLSNFWPLVRVPAGVRKQQQALTAQPDTITWVFMQ